MVDRPWHDEIFPKCKYQRPLLPSRAVLNPAGHVACHAIKKNFKLQIADMPLDFSCTDK